TLEQARAAKHGKPRLILCGNDLELETQVLLDAIKEHLPVGGRAARLCRDTTDRNRLARFYALRACGERLVCASHCAFAQPAGVCEALAQPNDARKSIDNFRAAVSILLRHQQAAIVCAQVQRREDRRTLPRARTRAAVRRMRLPTLVHRKFTRQSVAALQNCSF